MLLSPVPLRGAGGLPESSARCDYFRHHCASDSRLVPHRCFSLLCLKKLPCPIPEKEECAHCPQRSGQRDSRHSKPAHQEQIENNVQGKVKDTAVKNQVCAAHGYDEPVKYPARHEERNLNSIHCQHRRYYCRI